MDNVKTFKDFLDKCYELYPNDIAIYRDIDDYDKDLHGVVLNKEAALDYINDWMKTGKGVLKYDLDGKEYRVWKDENYPMKVWLDNIKQGLLD